MPKFAKKWKYSLLTNPFSCYFIFQFSMSTPKLANFDCYLAILTLSGNRWTSTSAWNLLNPLVQRDIAQIEKPITSALKKVDGGGGGSRTPVLGKFSRDFYMFILSLLLIVLLPCRQTGLLLDYSLFNLAGEPRDETLQPERCLSPLTLSVRQSRDVTDLSGESEFVFVVNYFFDR